MVSYLSRANFLLQALFFNLVVEDNDEEGSDSSVEIHGPLSPVFSEFSSHQTDSDEADEILEAHVEEVLMSCDDLATIPFSSSLSENERYKILTTKPLDLKSYPMNSQHRRFQHKWTDTFEWIRYSKSSDGIYCASCFIYSDTHFNGEFVSSPFCDWKNATGISRGALHRHAVSRCHQQCIQQAVALISVVEMKNPSIKSQLVKTYDQLVERNTKALISIIDVLQYTIKQGVSQRGHSWNKSTKREGGNFSVLVDLIATYSPCLSDHLLNAAKNARYLSPKIQNEFISINGNLIRQGIIDECNKSLYWSVMADEVVDVSTVEQVSICIRYVRVKSEELEVCEEFVGFTSVPSTTAEVLTAAIDSFFKSSGLNLAKLAGKGFDGASNMSGHISGVSARLQQLYPKAKYYTHCRNHALNLVIVASCNAVTDIRSFMNTFRELTLFFTYSSKRKHILRKHMSVQDQEDLIADSMDDDQEEENSSVPERKYRGLPVLSDTRWLTRVDSIDCLLKNFLSICKAIEEIRECSSGQSSSDADSFLTRLMTFEFVASGVICHYILAYTMARRLVESLKSERKEEKFHGLWSRITKIASDLGMEPSKKRTVTRQINRSNPPVTTVEQHYRVAYFFAFIDHCLNHLQTRFLEGALLATYFIPAKLCSLTAEVLTKLKSEFQDILPHPSELENEVNTWKVHMAPTDSESMDKKNNSLLYACTVAEKHKLYYPNIHAMLMLLLSLPVGTCSCERSFSSLRRLKTWCRNTMTSERLDSLATGYINHARTPTQTCVLKVWDMSGNRRIAVAFKQKDKED